MKTLELLVADAKEKGIKAISLEAPIWGVHCMKSLAL